MADSVDHLIGRTGARRRSEIPDEVLSALCRGQIETVNLVEFLAIDHGKLFAATHRQIGLGERQTAFIQKTIDEHRESGVMQRMIVVGAALHQLLEGKETYDAAYENLASHPSDVLRGWAAYMDAANARLTFAQRLKRARRFAIDRNMGVRELAWTSVRMVNSEELVARIERLLPWTRSRDYLVRRFAIEITRPCGVWTKHITALKDRPEIAQSLLENCKADETKYVQDSVANWLNDASKSRPEFVLETCDRWLAENDSKPTRRITHRALRTLRKQGRV